MKKAGLQRGLSLLLALVLVFAMSACGTDPQETQSTGIADTATQKAGTASPVKQPTQTAVPTTAQKTQTPAADPTATPVSNDPYKTNYYAVSGKAVIDGVIEDSWSKANTVELDEVKKDTPDPDTVVKASMMWDKDGFYFLFDITDPEISQTGSVGDYQNDSIYLYISELLQETGAFSEFTDGTYQFALISKELEKLPRYGEEEDLNFQSAYKITEKGMVIEFAYKPANAKLEAGTQMFLDFQYNDCAGGSRLGAIGWYNDSDENAITELWGVVKLIEAE